MNLTGPTHGDDVAVARMRALLSERVGYELPGDFHAFMVRQARALVRDLGLVDLQALAGILDSEPDGSRVWIRFISRMTIGESYLFRNPNHIDLLRRLVLPKLVERSHTRPVTIWSAGCARGEEPYTLAIMLHELDPAIGRRPVRIVATDIDSDALEAARQATYGPWAFRQTPYHIQRKYFTRNAANKTLTLHPAIASMVGFGYHHVALDHDLAMFPDDGFDLILCRNLLMYLRQDFRDRAGRGLANRLRREGVLLPGQVERIDGAHDILERMFVRGSAVYFPTLGGEAARSLFGPFLRETRRLLIATGAEISGHASESLEPPATWPPPPPLNAPVHVLDASTPSPGTRRAASAPAQSDDDQDGEDDAVLPSGELAQMADELGATGTPTSASPRGPQTPAEAVVDEVSRRLEALTASELYDTVRALVSSGRLDAARAHALALVQQEPLDAKHHCLLALVLLESEEAAAAIDALRRAVYLDPDSLTAYYIWWLVGVRYHGAAWERTQWARRHLVRLIAGVPDSYEVPLVGRVTAGDIRYLLQRDWHAF